MCRMLGLAAAEPVSAYDLLCEAPRSLRTLSREHADGWGVAHHDGDDWAVDRSTACAAASDEYVDFARRAARLLIAHVRKATVGCTTLANTHPFERDGLVFAHNGTVTVDLEISKARRAQITGETDSERLFAFVLTHVDAAGDVERGVAAAVRVLHAMTNVGSANFLLSCGARLYGHRLGRSLYTLARPWGVAVASERLTDEPWEEVPERGLVVVDAAHRYSIAA